MPEEPWSTEMRKKKKLNGAEENFVSLSLNKQISDLVHLYFWNLANRANQICRKNENQEQKWGLLKISGIPIKKAKKNQFNCSTIF